MHGSALGCVHNLETLERYARITGFPLYLYDLVLVRLYVPLLVTVGHLLLTLLLGALTVFV